MLKLNKSKGMCTLNLNIKSNDYVNKSASWGISTLVYFFV